MIQKIRLTVLAGLVFAATGVAPVQAEVASIGPIQAEAAWARATAPHMQAGAVFLTLHNTGSAPDRLIGAAAPVARVTELHTHLMEGGIMRMRPVEAIDLPPGQTVALQPGGDHVMLIGLTQRLVEGETFPLTLTFAQAGRLAVSVSIAPIGAMGPGQDHGSGHRHP